MIITDSNIPWLKDLPKDWEIKKVKDKFVFNNLTTKDYEKYPTLSLTMSGVKERDVASNEGQLPESFENYNLVNKECLVFNPMDLISGWVDVPTETGLISPSYKTLKINSEDVYIDYIKYYFQSLYSQKILFNFGEGVHHEYRWGISKETLKNFPIPLPKKDEQHLIVNHLDKTLNLINNACIKIERKIDLLEEQRLSIIKKLITKGIKSVCEYKESKNEWIGQIPVDWNVKKLKYVAKIIYGISPKETSYNDQAHGTILVNGPLEYSKTDFGKTRSLKWTTEPTKIIPKDSLLFCLRGSTTGRMNIAHDDVCIGRGVCAIRSEINQKFLVYCMTLIRLYIQDQISGSTFPSVTKDDVDNFVVPFPNIEEQNEIVHFLDMKIESINKLILLEKKRIKSLINFKQSLIFDYIIGKKRLI